MAAFNTNYLFSSKKNKTLPYVSIPKNVKESLNIDKVHKNGVFKIEPGTGIVLYDMCYIFEDISYTNQDTDKKNTTLNELMQLFKQIDSQMKITLATETGDIRAFVKDIFKPIYGDDYPIVEEGIGKWISQKIEEGTRNVERLLYLTMTVRARSFEDADAYFKTLDTALQKIFTALNSQLYRMSGEERLAVLQKILRLGDTSIPPRNLSPDRDGWKNQILPIYTKSEGDYLQVNNKYVCVLTAQDYESSLNEEKVVHSIVAQPFPTYVTLDIEPVRRNLVRDKILYNNTNNERAIAQENEANINKQQYGKEPSYQLRKTTDELESMIGQVDNEDDEGLFLGMYVIVYADTEDELFNRVDTLKALAPQNGYTLQPYMRMQRKALQTALPIGGRQVKPERFLLTSAAVAWQPFYSKDLHDINGMVMGLNLVTKRLLIGNRKLLPNPHSIVIGYTGFGKSFFIKTVDIAQPLLFTNDDIMVIDPNNELKKFIEAIRGQYFDFTPQSNYYYNPFEVPKSVWDADQMAKNRFIADRATFGASFVAGMMDGINVTRMHRTYVENAVKDVYEKYFSGKKFTAQPTFKTIYEKLKSYLETSSIIQGEQTMLLEITRCSEPFATGMYDMFAHPTNIDIHNRLVGFGLHTIQEEYLRKPIMLALMDFVVSRIHYNQEKLRASRLIVDEAQNLTKDDFIVKQLLTAIETYRKLGGIVTLAMQNVIHALEHPDLCKMFENCGYKVFFDQGGVGAKELSRVVQMSKQEWLNLGKGKVGHGVLVWNKSVYLMDGKMEKDNCLYPLFNTDFHEKAMNKAELEKQEEGFVLKERILSLLSVTPLKENVLKEMCYAEHGELAIDSAINDLLSLEMILNTEEGFMLADSVREQRW